MRVRALNAMGVGKLREFLADLRADGRRPVPSELLESDEASYLVPGGAEVGERPFASKLEAGEYLREALRSVEPGEVVHDQGLWSWLSLFYFDQLCPMRRGGRKPREEARYILSRDYRREYRHLLWTPYTLVDLHRNVPRVILERPVDVHDDFTEQLASRLDLVRNQGLMEAVDLLYLDGEGKPRRGATDRARPGSLRRLVSLLDQLDLTHDVFGLRGFQLMELLPREFDAWRG